MDNLNLIKRWSIIGFFVIVILGTLFHFVYPWSGNSILFAPFFPVNESVWEHFKLGLYAIIVFALVEHKYIAHFVKNYWLAKAVSIYVLSLTILLIYTSYTYYIQESILLFDISAYVIGVLIGQILAYKIYTFPIHNKLNRFGMILIIIKCLIFIIFTFYPPDSGLFQDQNTLHFGVDK